MSDISQKRSDEFLRISGQFKLGALVTEASHPVTAHLSDVAKQDIAAALKLLFDVDDDVVKTFREFVKSGKATDIAATVLSSLQNGGRIFFTGCGSTGRLSILLDSVWRDFWRQHKSNQTNNPLAPALSSSAGAGEKRADDFENRTFSVMAGGDYALIKSVEGFEDFTAFGKKQVADLGVSAKDVVFAITEGGETSFVIGTAWQGVEAGAKVYFVYNNPDDVLCQNVERSREIIEDSRIEKLNLTTGPMAITGSTRMQATSIQLCVMLAVLEMVTRDVLRGWGEPLQKTTSTHGLTRVSPHQISLLDSTSVPAQFLAALEELHAGLKSPGLRLQLAQIVALEESVYRGGGKNNYFADRLGIDVLTDTTERSPTYCTPPFRKFDDPTATESWAFLFLPEAETAAAWRRIIRREPRCVEWNESEARQLVGEDRLARTLETLNKIKGQELMRFRIGLDGLLRRPLKPGDCAIGILTDAETDLPGAPADFFRAQLEAAHRSGAKLGLIYFGDNEAGRDSRLAEPLFPPVETVFVPVPQTDFLLGGVTRVAVKLVMNALSTCTMVRLGRVLGNYMIWVVPSNLKLIDRATRYITKLTDLDYAAANALLFEIIEHVEPRMKSDQAYPPVVGMAVLRAKHGLTNEQAEARLKNAVD